MNITKIYDKILTLSPYVEVLVRNIYWRNVKRFRKYKSSVAIVDPKLKEKSYCDFRNITDFLKKRIMKGELLIVHSSYDALNCTNLSPDEIVEQLLDVVGNTGTLAMPVIRKFKGEPKYVDILSTNTDNLICTYNVKKTCVISGFLPYSLMKRDKSVTSRFPLNPLTAVGPLAEKMMMKNIEDEYPSAHGKNSAWKFCFDNNAIIVGLGIDICHHLTIIHVAEESMKWPISTEKWYRKRKFKIIDDDFMVDKIVLERKPKWGMLHSAEKTLASDLRKSGLLEEVEIGDVRVSIIKSKSLIAFLEKKKKRNATYPYFLCN